MTDEREVVEAFLAFMARTPRLYVARVLNSGASVDAGPVDVQRLVDEFLASRAPAGLAIARLMAGTVEWNSDTLDSIASILDQHQLGARCRVCGLFKVPDEPCVHDDLHEAEFDIETGGTTSLEDAFADDDG